MTRTTPRHKISAGAAALGLLVGTTGLTWSMTAASAADVATTFTYTGSAQRFVVPADVCSVTIDAYGAQGGAGSLPIAEGLPPASTLQPAAAPMPVAGGLGGQASSTVTVTPGEVLQVDVGGAGGDGTNNDPTSSIGGVGGAGGWNGGGAGGDGGYFGGGGGGGGASDVRQGGTTLGDRVVVAGGGGGTGGYAGDSTFDPQPVGGKGGNPATAGW